MSGTRLSVGADVRRLNIGFVERAFGEFQCLRSKAEPNSSAES